jgi:hypothetical protein
MKNDCDFKGAQVFIGFLTVFESWQFFKQIIGLKLRNRNQHSVSVCREMVLHLVHTGTSLCVANNEMFTCCLIRNCWALQTPHPHSLGDPICSGVLCTSHNPIKKVLVPCIAKCLQHCVGRNHFDWAAPPLYWMLNILNISVSNCWEFCLFYFLNCFSSFLLLCFVGIHCGICKNSYI